MFEPIDDISYKGYVLTIKEIPNFDIKGELYRGTSLIGNQTWVIIRPTVVDIEIEFRAEVDKLIRDKNSLLTYHFEPYQTVIYKSQKLHIHARKRVKDSVIEYLGGYLRKGQNNCTIQTIHYDKVISEFEKYVDEYCTDWQHVLNYSPYKGYVLNLKKEKDKEYYFGICQIHKNSVFKCISTSIKEIEKKFETRIDIVMKGKDKVKKDNVDGYFDSENCIFWYKEYSLDIYSTSNDKLFRGGTKAFCKPPEYLMFDSESIEGLTSYFKDYIDFHMEDRKTMTPKEQRIKELEEQLAKITSELEKVKQEKDIITYKGVTLEVEKGNWELVGTIKPVDSGAENFYKSTLEDIKKEFENYIDELEKSAKLYCKLNGKSILSHGNYDKDKVPKF